MPNPLPFVLTNNTDVNISISKIVFDVEPGIVPVVDLTEFGGSANHRAVEFIPPNSQLAIITAGGTKTMILDYEADTGVNAPRRDVLTTLASSVLVCTELKSLSAPLTI